jgi:hypothetical protein
MNTPWDDKYGTEFMDKVRGWSYERFRMKTDAAADARFFAREIGPLRKPEPWAKARRKRLDCSFPRNG